MEQYILYKRGKVYGCGDLTYILELIADYTLRFVNKPKFKCDFIIERLI